MPRISNFHIRMGIRSGVRVALGSQIIAYYVWVTVTLTLTSGLNSRKACPQDTCISYNV